MPRAALDIPPGLKRQATPAATGRRWWDMSLVRWENDVMQPVGGWGKLPGIQLNGAVRSLGSWRDLMGKRWVAAATLGQVMAYDTVGHDLTPGDFVAGRPGDLISGYGLGLYGMGLYGEPRGPSDPLYDPRGAPGDTVSLDTWGQNLVVTGSADGRILWWNPDDGFTPGLVPIPPAPATPEESAGIVHVVPTARYTFVTDERFIVALGARSDGKRVAWSDQERPGAWTPDIANQAGSLELNTRGIAWSARRCPQGHLIFCDDDVHLMTFVGTPSVYGIVRVGTGCSAISPNAMAQALSRTVWMGQESFWIWESTPLNLACDVQEFVFGNINRATQGRTVAAQNGLYPEIWWFYPDESSADPNRYVAWNYQKNLWIAGALSRTGICEPGAYGLPLMGDINGFIWAHELGWCADGADRGSSVFAETGHTTIGEGDQAMLIRAIYPDLNLPGQAQLRLRGQWEPEDQMEDYGVFPYERNDGVIDALVEARAFQFRVEGATQGNPRQCARWTLGRMRFDAVPGSGR